MTASHPPSRNCFDYNVKNNEVKNTAAEMDLILSIREEERRSRRNNLK